MECPAGGSLPLDVCRLDDRPPFLDLGLLQRPERLRRLLVPRENLKPISAKSARTFASADVSNIAALSFVMNVPGPSNQRLLPTERVAFPLNPVTIEYWRIVARRCGCGSLEVRNS
jgi:hypothetical protein